MSGDSDVRDLLAQAVEVSTDAIVCQDPSGVVLAWNAGAERLFGWTADAMVGEDAHVLLPDPTREALLAAWADALDGRRVERFDTALLRADGEQVPVSASMSPLRSADGTVIGLVTYAAGISDRVALAAELAAAGERLEQQNEALTRSNRDLEQFAYVASHDLSEPLRVMTGFVNLLASRYDEVLDERGLRYMRHIVEASERMRALIDDLLEYSRFLHAPRTRSAVDTTRVVEQVLASIADQIDDAGAQIDVRGLPSVWADESQLHSLLQNLLTNAIKFVADGTVPHVVVAGEEADGWVTLTVDDNGIGVEEEFRASIFGMFKRLHVREDYGGTGIGLAIAQQVVESEGGRLWVDGSHLGGARFCCTLPAVLPEKNPPDA